MARKKNIKRRKKRIVAGASPRRPKYYRAVWEPEIAVDPQTLSEVFGILFFVFAIFLLLAFLKLAGVLGALFVAFTRQYLGFATFALPFIFIFLGYGLLSPEKIKIDKSNFLGVFLLLISLSGIFHIFITEEKILKTAQAGRGGGFLGYLIYKFLVPILGSWGLFVVLLGLFFIALILGFRLSLKEIKIKLKSQAQQPVIKPEEASQEGIFSKSAFSPSKIAAKIFHPKEEQKEEKKPSLGPISKNLPPTNLLDDTVSYPSAGDVKKNAEIIKKTLANFGVPTEIVEINVGPTVTQYAIKPAEGIKLNKIVALANNLALALAAHPIRIEAPIPGKPYVGIEVPNKVRAIVRLREIIESEPFSSSKYSLTFGLGKNVSGKVIVDHLEGMPHLLIAGSTGSGKSICINSTILSFLYKNTPDKLKMILIDPKRVELPIYNDIPHLLVPVVTDHKEAISALKWATIEMDRRYKLFEKNLKRDVIAYNKTLGVEKLPYIVIFIDELADLMMLAPKEVEHAIVRLSQLARATGIHLVIATQRPSVDVITGLIKANITSRVAFATASQVDSRTILDMGGAEKLLGSGDMLYLSSDTSKPRRLQGSFVSEKEIERVVNFLRKQGQPQYIDEVLKMPVKSGIIGEVVDDDLFREAAELVVTTQKASASFLQRRFRIGYARAARLIDLLEERGVIGPGEGARPRDILIKNLEELNFIDQKDNESL